MTKSIEISGHDLYNCTNLKCPAHKTTFSMGDDSRLFFFEHGYTETPTCNFCGEALTPESEPQKVVSKEALIEYLRKARFQESNNTKGMWLHLRYGYIMVHEDHVSFYCEPRKYKDESSTFPREEKLSFSEFIEHDQL